MNARKTGMQGEAPPPASLFFGNLFVHTSVDEDKIFYGSTVFGVK